MQVDFRQRYLWSLQSGAVDSGTAKQWMSRSQFFSGDDEELTRHYAMAKEEVRFSVVHCLPSGIRWEDEIAPDPFSPFAECCVRQAALTSPNAIVNATAMPRM